MQLRPQGYRKGRKKNKVQGVIRDMHLPDNVRVNLRGMVTGMQESFHSFAFGLSLSVRVAL